MAISSLPVISAHFWLAFWSGLESGWKWAAA